MFGFRPQFTNHSFKCFPITILKDEKFNHQGRVILPPSMLTKLGRPAEGPMVFRLQNSQIPDLHVYAGVLEFDAEEGVAYLPRWMMKQLLIEETEALVTVTSANLKKGSFVKLQPTSSKFLDVSNPKVLLEVSFREFVALSEGSIITIPHGRNVYEMEILECKPDKAISLFQTDIQVDFAPPKDYIEPAPKPKPVPSQPALTSAPSAAPASTTDSETQQAPSKPIFTGTGYKLSGSVVNVPASSTSTTQTTKPVAQTTQSSGSTPPIAKTGPSSGPRSGPSSGPSSGPRAGPSSGPPLPTFAKATSKPAGGETQKESAEEEKPKFQAFTGAGRTLK